MVREVTEGVNQLEYLCPSSPQSEIAWNKVILGIVVSAVAVSLCWLAYSLFVKDCILLWKAKKQRRTEEIGFGNSPAVVVRGDDQGIIR